MKIKILVEYPTEGIKLWTTNNPDHVRQNIDSVIGLREMLDVQTRNFGPNTDVRHIIPFFYFIAFITINTSSGEQKMMLFDSENNIDNALDFYNALQATNADPEMKNNMMGAFKIVEDFYEEFKEEVSENDAEAW